MDVSSDAVSVLSDGVASGDVVMIIGGVVVLAVLVGLKLAKKSVPVLDTVLEVGLAALRKLRKPKESLPPEQPDEDAPRHPPEEAQDGVASVVHIRKPE